MAAEKVQKIQSVESCEALIEALANWHKAGEITAIMTVFFDKEGNISTHWSSIPSVTRAVGALERLKISICSDAGDC